MNNIYFNDKVAKSWLEIFCTRNTTQMVGKKSELIFSILHISCFLQYYLILSLCHYQGVQNKNQLPTDIFFSISNLYLSKSRVNKPPLMSVIHRSLGIRFLQLFPHVSLPCVVLIHLFFVYRLFINWLRCFYLLTF